MSGPHDATLQQFEKTVAGPDETHYELTLFVSGASDLSARAIANARRLCDAQLHGRCHLSVVDVHDNVAAALINGVVATPTLVKSRPLPARKLVGDLSQTDKVLLALELPVARDVPTPPG
jgi:circadian clock protein KaiB